MRLSQSVVLLLGRGSIQPYLLKEQVHIMARTAQISKEKTTVHHYFKTWRSVNPGTFWLQRPSSAMMKLALMRTATGKENPVLPLLQRISSLELQASEIAAQINASQSSSNRHISTSTVQRRLCESDLHGWISAKKPLLKDTNNKKRLVGPRNTSNGH